VLTAGAEFPRRRFTGTRRSRRSGAIAGLLACGLAVEYERGMGNPLVGSGRGGIGRRGWLVVIGGSGSPACMRSRHCSQLTTTTPRAKEPGSEEESHRGLVVPGAWRSTAGGEVVQRRRSG
jgi:hypothetical protein